VLTARCQWMHGYHSERRWLTVFPRRLPRR